MNNERGQCAHHRDSLYQETLKSGKTNRFSTVYASVLTKQLQ